MKQAMKPPPVIHRVYPRVALVPVGDWYYVVPCECSPFRRAWALRLPCAILATRRRV